MLRQRFEGGQARQARPSVVECAWTLPAHHVGIDAQVGDYPPTFQSVEPAFDGAVSSGATSMADATQPGQSESFSFTASEAGDYAMVCYLPGHATAGMWIHFTVSAEGEAGLREM